ncbi:MAG: acyl-CoA dehydrogenase family protein [Bacteroidales bacterium]|nr:acyl-CoA dehydrogenase family protein [Bacteroidales bacterium]MBN2818252.1 acyl-CoA dehydrogenase family protein [Bacteroidales bacterium]
MNFLVKEKHLKIVEKVKEFAEQEVKPVIVKFDEEEKFPVDIIRKLGELKVFGMHVPEEYGGMGTDTLSYIMTVEELAKVDSSVAACLTAHNSLGIGPILEFGSEQQKKERLPALCTGENLWAFGLTEKNAGSDALGVETRAKPDGDQYVLNGSKIFITNGYSELTRGLTVLAQTGLYNGKKELSTLLVDKETPGFTGKTMHGKLLWRAVNNAELNFDNCRVPEENLLGKRGQGSKVMLKTLDSGRLSVAAMGLGLAEGAYAMARDYAKKRQQFGKPISHFQVISFKLADMAMKIELAKNTLYNACWLKDQGKEFSKQAAMAKLYSSEIAGEIANEAMQIFGGYGFLKENHIERFFRDQKLLQVGEGTSEILRLVISRKIMKENEKPYES